MGLLDDKTAVITGGSSGIGRETARTFAQEGADVLVADVQKRPRKGGEPTHEVIAEETKTAPAFINCDVVNRNDLEAVFSRTSEYGGVDILVNAAAIFGPDDFLTVTEEDYDRIMDVNVKGTYFCSQLAAAQMVNNDTAGSIVNISSLAGLSGRGDFLTYSVSKGAVRLLTYSLADYLGSAGIRANSIYPGLTETQMVTEDLELIGTEAGKEYLESIPLGAPAQPQDIANVALFLASHLSSHITGEGIVVDGGKHHTS